MNKIRFEIGQRVSGYLVFEGEPFLGYISGFDGVDSSGRELAQVRVVGTKEYYQAYVDTFHPMPLDKIVHSKQSFLAAASRCGPSLYFKNQEARRDYLEGLWKELQNYTQEKE